jgi:polysaccharide export outer membrane protein
MFLMVATIRRRQPRVSLLSELNLMAGVLFMTLVIALGSPGLARPAQATAPSPSAPSDESAESPPYKVGPGDVLKFFVWKEPDLSGELVTRIDGKVTIPLLGDVEASGRTPEQLASEVSKALKRFLAAPQVTVGLVSSASGRFFVLGQVARPGDFPLRGRTTVLQGLALAGGFREFAKTDGIVVVRQDKGFFLPKGRPSETFITVNYKRLEGAREVGENIVLRPGDTILVP